MFLAISAFLFQGMFVSISKARAALGEMPAPSVTLDGFVHFHDRLAGQVHVHGGDEGHVHDGVDHDDDHGPNLTWDIFGTSIASPEFVALTNAFELFGLVGLPQARTIEGVRPDALLRPPSTLSIA
jgi:hypothetical protein